MDAKQCVNSGLSDVEFDVLPLEAGDLLFVLVVDIREHRVRALGLC